MEHLKEEIGIILYEYVCDTCTNFFWISHLLTTELNCPHCSRKVYLNGVLPISEIKFKEEKEINKGK